MNSIQDDIIQEFNQPDGKQFIFHLFYAYLAQNGLHVSGFTRWVYGNDKIGAFWLYKDRDSVNQHSIYGSNMNASCWYFENKLMRMIYDLPSQTQFEQTEMQNQNGFGSGMRRRQRYNDTNPDLYRTEKQVDEQKEEVTSEIMKTLGWNSSNSEWKDIDHIARCMRCGFNLSDLKRLTENPTKLTNSQVQYLNQWLSRMRVVFDQYNFARYKVLTWSVWTEPDAIDLLDYLYSQFPGNKEEVFM
jgi:hypothetical protein